MATEMGVIFDVFKKLHRDLSKKVGRYAYIEYFLREIPGDFGIALRECWYRKRFKSAGTNLHIKAGTHFVWPERIECGDNTFFGGNNFIQAGGGLKLGSNVMFGPYAKIWTQNHMFKDYHTPVWKQGYEFKPVQIGNDVWVGADVFIMPGVEIGDKCIVSAASVVGAKHYPSGSILAGNPARTIGSRAPEPDSSCQHEDPTSVCRV